VLLTVFGYYASSICITVVLSGFLAILFDPVVVKLEKMHLPRGVAAAGVVLCRASSQTAGVINSYRRQPRQPNGNLPKNQGLSASLSRASV
jgi:hypothetical protein